MLVSVELAADHHHSMVHLNDVAHHDPTEHGTFPFAAPHPIVNREPLKLFPRQLTCYCGPARDNVVYKGVGWNLQSASLE